MAVEMDPIIFLPKKYFYNLVTNDGFEQSLKSFGFELFIKLSTNNVDKQGDIIVNLLSSLSSKVRGEKIQSSVTCMKDVENFWRNQSLLAGFTIIGDSSYKITVKRCLFFKLSLSSSFEPEVWLKEHRPKGYFEVSVKLSCQCRTSSVSDSRCLLTRNHIVNLFQMASIAVNINSGYSSQSLLLNDEDLGVKCSLQQASSTISSNFNNTDGLLSFSNKLEKENVLKNVAASSSEEESKLNINKIDLEYVVESNCNSKCDGAILLCSPVISQRERMKLKINSDQYISLLEEELYKASLHKHGDLSSKSWKEFLSSTARNCQILQFMCISHLTPIKVDINDEASNSRAGAFILYNYARICMLLKNLQNLIDRKLLPPIPPSYTVDFSLLKHQEEWELCWVYVSRLPELLHDTLDEIISLGVDASPHSVMKDLEFCSKSKIKAKTLHFPTHKIAKFLHNLSHCWSIYYSRVHILPEVALLEKNSSVHLIPTLWARVYLIKAVQTTIDTCFKTLDIVPSQVM